MEVKQKLRLQQQDTQQKAQNKIFHFKHLQANIGNAQKTTTVVSWFDQQNNVEKSSAQPSLVKVAQVENKNDHSQNPARPRSISFRSQSRQEAIMDDLKQTLCRLQHEDPNTDLSQRRATKIVCTIGCGKDQERMQVEPIRQLIKQGMDVARINMDNFEAVQMEEVVQNIRKAQELEKKPIAIMVDLKGLLMRLKPLGNESNKINVVQDQKLFLTSSPDLISLQPDQVTIGIEEKGVTNQLNEGDIITLNYGAVELEVVRVLSEDYEPINQDTESDKSESTQQEVEEPSLLNLSSQNTDDLSPSKMSKKMKKYEDAKNKQVTYNQVSIDEGQWINDDDNDFEDNLERKQKKINQLLEQKQLNNKDGKETQLNQKFQTLQRRMSTSGQDASQIQFQMNNSMNRQTANFNKKVAQSQASNLNIKLTKQNSSKNMSLGIMASSKTAKPSSNFKDYQYQDKGNKTPQPGNKLVRPDFTIINRNIDANKVAENETKESKNHVIDEDKEESVEINSFSSSSKSDDVKIDYDNKNFYSVDKENMDQKGEPIKINLMQTLPEHEHERILECKANNSGTITGGKAVYFQSLDYVSQIRETLFSTRDLNIIHNLVHLGVNFICLSCVESAKEIQETRQILRMSGGHNVQVLSKIQSLTALQNFDEILEHSDGIIIARGYLGLELENIEDIVDVQKYIIKRCNLAGKPVLLSTQIMNSMIKRMRPTRAEVNDINNAIIDGIDSLILSDETAVGQFPEKVTEMLQSICNECESNIDYIKRYQEHQGFIKEDLADKISKDPIISLYDIWDVHETLASCAVRASFDLKAKLIIVLTHSGSTARLMAKHMPKCPLLVVSPNEWAANGMLIHRNFHAMLVGSLIGSQTLLQKVLHEAFDRGMLKRGDSVVVMSGMSGNFSNENMLNIITV